MTKANKSFISRTYQHKRKEKEEDPEYIKIYIWVEPNLGCAWNFPWDMINAPLNK